LPQQAWTQICGKQEEMEGGREFNKPYTIDQKAGRQHYRGRTRAIGLDVL